MLTVARSRAAAMRARRRADRAVCARGARRLLHHDDRTPPAASRHDYRERHPIAIKEGERTVELFVGSKPRRALAGAARRRARLRAELEARSDRRHHHRSCRPARANERAAADALQEVRVDPRAAGVPQQRHRRRGPTGRRAAKLATLRLNYPLMIAEAGPCGLWPDDLGPSYDREHFENRQY